MICHNNVMIFLKFNYYCLIILIGKKYEQNTTHVEVCEVSWCTSAPLVASDSQTCYKATLSTVVGANDE